MSTIIFVTYSPNSDSPLAPIRKWLRSDMLVLRWVFAALYLLILAGFCIPTLLDLKDMWVVWLCLYGPFLTAQALFIFGGGTINLCKPVSTRRLWMPILAATTMFALLVLGLGLAMMELLGGQDPPGVWGYLLLGTVGVCWIGWGVLAWAYFRSRRLDRKTTLGRLATVLFAGSLAELMACIPAHIIVSKRPGCVVGLSTMLGIVAGVYVMLFSFGPLIVLLFLRPRYRQEQMENRDPTCLGCEYNLTGTLMAGRTTCPECGLAIPDSVIVNFKSAPGLSERANIQPS